MHFRTTRLALLPLTCLAAATVPFGCGNEDEESAEDIARAYVQARNQGDAARICELYAEELSQRVPGQGNCRAFVTQQISQAKRRSPKARTAFVRVDENGDSATAVLTLTVEGKTGELSIPLVRAGDDWEIAGVEPLSGY